MNWKEVLGRLPLNILKNLNKSVVKEAQSCYYTVKVRCFRCEDYLTFESDQEGLQLVQQILNRGWAYREVELFPHFVKFEYFCPKCQSI